MKKLLMIVNPGAGRGGIGNSLFSIINQFTENGYRVEVHPTQNEGDATEFVGEHGECFDFIVCCGGDGTVNEVIAGMHRLKSPPPLGIIPSGTTNDFSHTIGMPKRPLSAAKAICDGDSSPCDIGLLNGRPFVYVAAFGLFTALTYSTPQQNKQIFGLAAYVAEGLKDLHKLSPVNIKLQHDNGVIEGEYLICMITNTVSVAGFRRMFENVASLNDGKFEVTLISRPNNVNDIQKIINILLSLESLESVDNDVDCVTVFSTSHISVTSQEEIVWTVDGQNAGSIKTAEIEVIKHAIGIVNHKQIQ